MILLNIFVFLFGAILGSFLNVLIHRIPKEENVVFPRSHCPSCLKIIPWFENIPLFSFLYLKGKCSGCRAKIHWRYPLVELLMGLGILFLWDDSILMGNGLWIFLLKLITLSILIVHFFIDLEHQILPDILNLILGVLFLSYAFFHYSWGFWFFGALIGAGFPLLVTWGFYLVRGQIGLGGGDIKLFGILGLYLGPVVVIHTIFLSCFIGALFGGGAILMGKMDKSKPIAFGPFIIIVAALQIFFPQFFEHYLIFI